MCGKEQQVQVIITKHKSTLEKTMNKIVNLDSTEKKEYLGYLLILYFLTAIILGVVLFFKVINPFKMISDEEREILRQASIYEEKQSKAVVMYDEIMEKVATLKKTPESAVLKADIEKQIKLLGSFNDGLPNGDVRNISFQQMATFLQRYYEDAMIMQKTVGNYTVIETQLNECRMGLNRNEDNLNQIRAAQITGE